jgi:transcriptional regulator with XRE-family HTH domain
MRILTERTLIDLETGPLVKEARTAAGMSQLELAARLGTTQSAVSRWERGHDEPRLSRLAAILRACGFHPRLRLDSVDGVDRAQIRQQLALSPAERLASVTNLSRFVTGARRA